MTDPAVDAIHRASCVRAMTNEITRRLNGIRWTMTTGEIIDQFIWACDPYVRDNFERAEALAIDANDAFAKECVNRVRDMVIRMEEDVEHMRAEMARRHIDQNGCAPPAFVTYPEDIGCYYDTC